MSNYICTWFCEDQKGEESIYPQTGQKSSSFSHQAIYWRCVITFYITSVKFNKDVQHLFFTNATQIPVIDGKNVADLLSQLGVSIIRTDFKYKTPKGYYKAWQNQFYEFSILEYISSNYTDENDLFMILDSDCLFIKSAAPIFDAADKAGGFLSYEYKYPETYDINGINKLDMKAIYEEFLGKKIEDTPSYHAGEFFLCSTKNLKKIFADFLQCWPKLLEKHNKGEKKFNEEAHTLSFLYFKNRLPPGGADNFIKRIWTNPAVYRDVEKSDDELIIWHLPSEKTFGLPKLYKYFVMKEENLGLDLSVDNFTKAIKRIIGVPKSSFLNLVNYHVYMYRKAIEKKIAYSNSK